MSEFYCYFRHIRGDKLLDSPRLAPRVFFYGLSFLPVNFCKQLMFQSFNILFTPFFDLNLPWITVLNCVNVLKLRCTDISLCFIFIEYWAHITFYNMHTNSC